ncbi:MAG: hypothetical protein IKI46_04010 [Lachnospiraceae bacterium]|nr:hypothetical protein [Lachnospiraceae bacterium]
MKIRFKIITIMLSVLLIAGCGSSEAEGTESEELKQFRTQVDTFCQTISDIDAQINSIDTATENYATDIMNSLNSLNTAFADFAAIDFPADYDYLEHLADEASVYMSEAVTLYGQVYTDNSLNSQAMQDKYNEASTSYANAFKRIKVIMTFLNGEVSEDANVSTESSGTLTEGSGQ